MDVDDNRLVRFVVFFCEDVEVKRIVFGCVSYVFFFKSTREGKPIGKVELIWLRKMRRS